MPLVKLGQRLPDVPLAEIVGSELRVVNLEGLLAGRRAIIVGLPGAFTPTCSERHIPQFVAAADGLKAAGYDMILVILPNDPWVAHAFAQAVDPQRKLRFLSDGNLSFVRAAGLDTQQDEFFMGARSARYVLVTRNAVVERVNVEPTIISMSCTNLRDVVEVEA